jgi:hypothetical protein
MLAVLPLQLLIDAILPGCICGLIAMGFALVRESTRTVSFAQGELMMLGAFAGLVASTVPVHDFGAEEAFADRVVPDRDADACVLLPARNRRDMFFHRKDLRRAAVSATI